jgi:hypothetical protein
VLNPGRAKMVRRARDWPWSSYRATAGQTEIPELLTVDWVLSQFDSDRERAVRAYRRFVRQGRGINVWDELRAGTLLGSDGFVDQLRPLLKEKPLDPEYRRRERFAARPSLEELFMTPVPSFDCWPTMPLTQVFGHVRRCRRSPHRASAPCLQAAGDSLGGAPGGDPERPSSPRPLGEEV